MSSRRLQNWLKEYAAHTQHSEAPLSFHFWTGVSVIAGALRRQVWIDQRHFQWTPNFYIILVGPPGVVTKSTSMRVGVKLLRELPSIHMGPQSMTWQGLTMALQEAKELVEHPPGTFLPMSCITCDVGELGTFLRPEDARMMDVLTDLWDGQLTKWEHKLRTQEPIEIENPWINMLACTTPTWLRKNIPESMIGGGLLSRVIFVYGDKKSNLVAYPADLIEDVEYKNREANLIHDLARIGELRGEMCLTPEARAWGIDWYRKHWTTRPEHLLSERYDGYLGRKQTHIHKLAMVLSAAESDNMLITEQHLEFANSMMGMIELDMIRVFESIGQVQSNLNMNELVSTIRQHRIIERMDLWRACMRSMSQREFSEAIEAAISADLISIVQRGTTLLYMTKVSKKKGEAE